MSWEKSALCKGMPINNFFEDYETDKELAREMDSLCSQCPVKLQCLTRELELGGTGLHGGVYLIEGKYSKSYNRHKNKIEQESFMQLIDDIKDSL